MEFTAPFLVLGAIGLAIFFRMVAGSMDGDRVDCYIRKRGGRIIEKHWSPFGKGWFGEKDSRIYEVTYQDAEGNLHEATCKTSMLSGVYFTEDRIVQQPRHQEEHDDENQFNATVTRENTEVSLLQEENRRLRKEIERLRNTRQDE